jgi:hypothetical protein
MDPERGRRSGIGFFSGQSSKDPAGACSINQEKKVRVSIRYPGLVRWKSRDSHTERHT